LDLASIDGVGVRDGDAVSRMHLGCPVFRSNAGDGRWLQCARAYKGYDRGYNTTHRHSWDDSQQNKRNYDVCIGLCIVSWIDADNTDTSRRRSVAWHAYHQSEATRSTGGSGHRLALAAVRL